MRLITDIAEIEKISEKQEKENMEFRMFLKWTDMPGHQIDALVRDIVDEVSAKIDCTQCANCCKICGPLLVQRDVHRLANHLELSEEDFCSRFLKKDQDGEGHLFSSMPCPFLENGCCSLYESRPEDCRSYPHLHKNDFTTRLLGVVTNCYVCPIVFNVYEQLKARMWNRRRR